MTPPEKATGEGRAAAATALTVDARSVLLPGFQVSRKGFAQNLKNHDSFSKLLRPILGF
jgi:hypothetical protein